MEMFHTSSIKMYYTIFKEINTRVGGLSLCTAQLTSFFFYQLHTFKKSNKSWYAVSFGVCCFAETGIRHNIESTNPLLFA